MITTKDVLWNTLPTTVMAQRSTTAVEDGALFQTFFDSLVAYVFSVGMLWSAQTNTSMFGSGQGPTHLLQTM